MKLMVLDGNSVINRAYYGVRALTTKDGFFTNAIYGFLNILEKLRAEEQPERALRRVRSQGTDIPPFAIRRIQGYAPSHA